VGKAVTLMIRCCIFAGDFLGHSGPDGGLLHIHQQEGL